MSFPNFILYFYSVHVNISEASHFISVENSTNMDYQTKVIAL